MANDIRVQWVASEYAPSLPITQVYGYCFNEKGQILLIKDQGSFNLPGGKPEKGESFEETLHREVLEEAQAFLGDTLLFGYQLVWEDSKPLVGQSYAQLRMIAQIIKLLPSGIDPATGRQYERCLYRPEQVQEVLRWGQSGQAQLSRACLLAKTRWNIPLSETKVL